MSDMNVPFLAPGCFGSALMFKATDMVCSACPFHTDCGVKHEVALALLRQQLGVTVAQKSVKQEVVHRPAPHPAEEPVAMTMPKKVKELIERFDRGSYDIVAQMQKGINPFVNLPGLKFMKIACHMIMKTDRHPATQKFLQAGMIHALHHTEATAAAHARMALQALLHIGAIEQTDGVYRVKA